VLSILVHGDGGAREVRHGLIAIHDGEVWDGGRTNGPFETLSGFIAALGQNMSLSLRGLEFRRCRPSGGGVGGGAAPFEPFALAEPEPF